MSRSAEQPLAPAVELLDVTEEVLELLLSVALNDAGADDVTPPLGDTDDTGGTAGWNPERIDWFRRYHRAAAAGMDGPARQKSWAVGLGGEPVGSVRLRRTGPDTAETGIWLGRSVRGRGLGTEVLRLVLAEARTAGLRQVAARTTRGNSAAQRILTACGALLAFDGDAVTAVVVLDPPA